MALVLSLFILDVEGCDPTRKVRNVLALLLGAGIVAGASFWGLISAKRRYEGSYRQ